MFYVFYAPTGKIVYKGNSTDKVKELGKEEVFIYWDSRGGLIQLCNDTLKPLPQHRGCSTVKPVF